MDAIHSIYISILSILLPCNSVVAPGVTSIGVRRINAVQNPTYEYCKWFKYSCVQFPPGLSIHPLTSSSKFCCQTPGTHHSSFLQTARLQLLRTQPTRKNVP